MSANSNQQRRGPPLAGRPPFATDEDDSVFADPPARPRQRQQQQPNQQPGRDSMYQAWDNYLANDKDKDSRPNSGVGGIGMGLMAGGLDDSDEEDQPPARKPQAAPPARSNVPAKSSNLRPSQPNNAPRGAPNTVQPLARPPPAAMAGPPGGANNGRNPYDRPQYAQNGQQQPPAMAQAAPRQGTGFQRPAAAALRVDVPQPAMPIPRAPIPAFMQSPSPSPSPSFNPHPLNAPSTPITPVFARPSFAETRKVEFAKDAIMRGNSEETLLPRNTQKGDEFWRRFSFIAKDDISKKKKSKWLRTTLGGSSRMSKFIWCISIFLLLCIGGGIGFGWYMTHNDPASLPVAVGGSANESQVTTGTRATSSAHSTNTSRTLVAPTVVGTKRGLPEQQPTPTPAPQPTAVARRAHLKARNRLNRLD